MADFMTNLWGAVFEAGPTPTLLIATNVTFAALQIVLFVLLVGTHSIHFVILSLLCAGLWLSINWFARELQAVQAAESQEADRKMPLSDATSIGTSSATSGITPYNNAGAEQRAR